MAINRRRVNQAYGMGDNLITLAPEPIVAQRAPASNDLAQIGTNWIDTTSDVVYVLTSVTGGSSTWSTTPAAGATVLASLQITGGAGTQLIVDAGNVVITSGNLTLDAGNLTVTGNTNLTGNLVIAGDFDVTDTGSISLTSTNDAADAIYLLANGGTSETIRIRSDQGTSVTSVALVSDVGGISLTSGLASDDAINLSASAGGIDIDGALQVNIASSENAVDAIVLTASAGGIDILAAGTAGEDIDIVATGSSVNVEATEAVATAITINASDAAGGIDIDAGSGDIDVTATLGNVNVTSTLDAAAAIYLHANAGTSETIHIHSDQGTGVDSINVASDVGGITLASGLASDDAINLSASAGGVDVDGALQVNIASSEAAADALVLAVSDAAGGIQLNSSGNIADSIYLHANAGTTETIRLHADQGTGVASIALTSDVGGITISSGLASDDAINFSASAGGVDVDAVLQLNLASSEAAATAVVVSASDAAGGIQLNSSGNIADSIYLHADAGTSEKIRVHADQGTAVDSVALLSDVGGITLTSGLASDDAINFSATAGGFDVDAALQLNLASSEAAADAIVLSVSNAAGGIQLNSAGDIADSIYLHADAGTSEKIRVHADQGTAVDSVALTSDVGGITLTSGLASDDAINFAATAGGFDVDAALQLNLASSEAAADAIVLSASNAAGGVDVTTGGGEITMDTGATGNIKLTPGTNSVAGVALTLNAKVGVATFTGQTTAAAAQEAFTITNSEVGAGSGMIVTVTNIGAGDARMTLEQVKSAAGSFIVNTQNNGAATLDGDVIISWIVLN